MKRVLLLAAVLVAPGVAWGQTYKPDFDCAKIPPNNGVAVMLCQNSDAARQELIFDQTYYALRQKVGPEGWKSLKQEVVLSENAMNQQCGLPIPGEANQEIPEQGAACYIEGMSKLTEQYKQRLSGSALEEANRDIDQHIALQQKLIDLGYLPETAVADGVYGESTRQAIAAWKTNSRGASAGDFISDSDASALKASDKNKIVATKISSFKKEVSIDGVAFTVSAYCNPQDETCSNVSLLIKEGDKKSTFQLKSLDDLGKPNFSFDKPIFGSQDVVVYGAVFTGGAHCCVNSLLIFKNEKNEWSLSPLPEQDGGPENGSPYRDLAGDGHHEIPINDMRFDYIFDCFACSFPPTKIFELRFGRLEDVSGERRFRPFLENEIKRAEAEMSKGASNMGLYAGIAAIKAQEGNFMGYWDEKIKTNPDFRNLASISYCDAVGIPQSKCPESAHDPLNFPNALAIFLYKTGYIDQYDLYYTGYTIRNLDKSDYDRAHPLNSVKYYLKVLRYKISSLHSYAPSLSDWLFYSIVFFILFLVFLSFAFYFLPIFIASRTKSQHFWLIAFVNVFFGWTFLGWLAALLMALMMDRDRRSQL